MQCMKITLLLISLFIGSQLLSQTTIDTTFSIRGNTCQCKLVKEGTADVKPFDLNEKPAYYPGGEDAWEKFVKKNINKKLKGKDAVEVHVEINEKGELSGFRLLNRAANQKYEEAVYILKLSGNWFPAIQNGYCVKSVKRLVLEF
jgi:periplasmic protein TonB